MQLVWCFSVGFGTQLVEVENAIFHRSAISHFPFKLFHGQSYNIIHNPKCKITLFEDRSILESALQLKVSFSLAVLPSQISTVGDIVHE